MGIAAMVLGILGLVTCWVPFVGVFLGLLGLILGIITLIKKSGNKAFGIIGLVVGGIGMIIGAIITTGVYFAAGAGLDALDEYQQQNNPAEQLPFNP